MGKEQSHSLEGEAGGEGRRQWIIDRISRAWEAISVAIPGTNAFKKRRQNIANQSTKRYTKWIDELNALSPEAKQRLGDRILYHMGRLSTIDALGQIFPTYRVVDAAVPLMVLGLLGSVFAALLWLGAEYRLWVVVLIFCLSLIPNLVVVVIILLLAAAIAGPVRLLARESSLVWLLMVTGMVLAALVYWQGYLQSRDALGVLGYPVSETAATWVIVVVGGLYLLVVFHDIAKKARGGGRLKALFKRLLELDNLLMFLAGVALVGFPLYRSLLASDSSPVSVLNSAVVVGVFGALVFWIGMGALSVILALLESETRRHKLRRCPDAVLVYELFWILSAVEQGYEKWQHMSFKQSILTRLETAATAMARIGRDLHCGDAVTDAWSVKEFRNKAAFLRYLKTWVLTPMADTRDVFMNRIARELAYAADGSWDALAKPEDEKILTGYLGSRSWRSFASSLLRSSLKLVTGIIPLGGILALQQTAFALEQSMADYLTVGATIWAVVRVLEILDPQFAQTLTTVKEVQDYLP